MMTVLAAMPVSEPEVKPIVETEIFPDVQVPPPMVLLNSEELPTQTEVSPTIAPGNV
jgi:hypothetical protein